MTGTFARPTGCGAPGATRVTFGPGPFRRSPAAAAAAAIAAEPRPA